MAVPLAAACRWAVLLALAVFMTNAATAAAQAPGCTLSPITGSAGGTKAHALPSLGEPFISNVPLGFNGTAVTTSIGAADTTYKVYAAEVTQLDGNPWLSELCSSGLPATPTYSVTALETSPATAFPLADLGISTDCNQPQPKYYGLIIVAEIQVSN